MPEVRDMELAMTWGIGEHPNKQENVRPRESGSRAIFRKCIYTCIACWFLRVGYSPIPLECVDDT